MPWPWVQAVTTSKLGGLGPAARADCDFHLKLSKIESWGKKKKNPGFENTLWPQPLRI